MHLIVESIAGGRMAVLRLRDGSIWVHSPVQLDDDLADALSKLGHVKHIVSPNYEHTKYAQQVQTRLSALLCCVIAIHSRCLTCPHDEEHKW